ncbi:hypothetical protein Ciccas_003773 [Cichlidogyrus casuarinus]|uniref:Uncharacterized protein n=1 Tax=Cichlidogyrus casuarinus TaxID=1844966 RepID=A0ABD2QDE7_9PLAT
MTTSKIIGFEATNTALKTAIPSLSEASSPSSSSDEELPKPRSPPVIAKASAAVKRESKSKATNEATKSTTTTQKTVHQPISLGLSSLSSTGSLSSGEVSSTGSLTPPMSLANTDNVSQPPTLPESTVLSPEPARSRMQRKRYTQLHLKEIYEQLTKACSSVSTVRMVAKILHSAEHADNGVECFGEKTNNHAITFDLERLADCYLDALSGLLGLPIATAPKLTSPSKSQQSKKSACATADRKPRSNHSPCSSSSNRLKKSRSDKFLLTSS